MMAGISKQKRWKGQYDLAAVILPSSCYSMLSVTCYLSDFSILSDICQKLTILNFSLSTLHVTQVNYCILHVSYDVAVTCI